MPEYLKSLIARRDKAWELCQHGVAPGIAQPTRAHLEYILSAAQVEAVIKDVPSYLDLRELLNNFELVTVDAAFAAASAIDDDEIEAKRRRAKKELLDKIKEVCDARS